MRCILYAIFDEFHLEFSELHLTSHNLAHRIAAGSSWCERSSGHSAVGGRTAQDFSWTAPSRGCGAWFQLLVLHPECLSFDCIEFHNLSRRRSIPFLLVEDVEVESPFGRLYVPILEDLHHTLLRINPGLAHCTSFMTGLNGLYSDLSLSLSLSFSFFLFFFILFYSILSFSLSLSESLPLSINQSNPVQANHNMRIWSDLYQSIYIYIHLSIYS